MLQRCGGSTRAEWPRYGGRGITVCERWRWFPNFLADMGACPPERSLDRIDNDGNYEPGNCRWATMQQQVHNRHTACGELHGSAKLRVNDVIAIRELARRGVSYQSLASTFGVSVTNIGTIVRHESWRRLVKRPGIEPVASERPMRSVLDIDFGC